MDWITEFFNFLEDPKAKELNGSSYPTNIIDNILFDFSHLDLDLDEIYSPKKIVNFHFSNVVFSSFVYKSNLIFQDCLFGRQAEGFDINNVTEIERFKCNMLHFSNCLIESRLSISAIDINTLILNGLYGKGEVLLINCKTNNTTLRSKVDGKELEKLTLNNIGEIQSLIIRDINISHINFEYALSPSVLIGDGKYSKIGFNGSGDIQNFRIENSKVDTTGLYIKEFNLLRKRIKGHLDFNFCKIDNLKIEQVRNIDEGFSLKCVEIGEKLEIISSTLENTFWNDINLEKAKLIFDYTFFKGLKYANIVWPKNFILDSRMEGLEKLKVLTEVYRQLKSLASDNKNLFDQLKFQRLELSSYWERVKIDKSERRTDRFLLRIDRLFSNFGQDYLRPIGWLFGIQLVLCSIIWWREDVFHNYNASDYYQAAENGLSQYLTMLIPIFKTPEYWTGMSVSISIIIRLFNALMIYYFIRGVHKFGKN